MNSRIARKFLVASTAVLLCASSAIGTAHAQDADQRADAYVALLQQIANVQTSIDQKQAYIANQDAQIASLKAQIKGMPALKKTIRPIATAMAAEIEKEMNKDVPFRAAERFARLSKLRDAINDPAVGESEIYRQAMTIYDVEVNYGNSVSAYEGNNPVTAGRRLAACEADQLSAKCDLSDDIKKALKGGATLNDLKSSLQDGNYLHFGRLSLLYLERDSSEGFRYNQETGKWDALPKGDIMGVRQAVRIARGESAPATVRGPVTVSN